MITIQVMRMSSLRNIGREVMMNMVMMARERRPPAMDDGGSPCIPIPGGRPGGAPPGPAAPGMPGNPGSPLPAAACCCKKKITRVIRWQGVHL